MCGRFTLTTDNRAVLGDRFGVELWTSDGLERFNVAPTEAIVAVGGEPRKAEILKWGIEPPWKGPILINARSETAFAKAPFKRLISKPERRVLILADGFYEWLRPEDVKAARIPFRFSRADGAPFAFAGLETFGTGTILTCAPNELVARLHDRMPVILAGPEEEAAWLTADIGPDDVPELCRPLGAALMRSVPANPRVNKAGEDGPEMLAAPEPGAAAAAIAPPPGADQQPSLF